MTQEELFELLRTFVPVVGVVVALVGVVYAIRSYGINKIKRVAAAVGAALYTASPVDIIPDVLIPLGIVDDASVIVIAVVYNIIKATTSNKLRS
jgi:uncharacterized membrane protein YkvA (DUF1232 family)